MSRYKELIKHVVLEPKRVLRGKYGKLKAIGLIGQTHLGSKYLVVVYYEEKEEKVIITAYFTSNLKKVKGEMVWRA